VSLRPLCILAALAACGPVPADHLVEPGLHSDEGAPPDAGPAGEAPAWAQPLDADAVPSIEVPLVLINEVMTRNDSTVMAADLSTPDWIELYNASEVAVDLSQLALEDDSGARWTGGEGELAPGGWVLLWCDGDLEDPNAAPFALSSEGEHLTLSVDGVVTDRVWTGLLDGDVALARYPDGADWSPTVLPSPGWRNIRPNGSVDPSETIYQDEHITDVWFWLTPENYDELDGGGWWGTEPEVLASMMFEGVYFDAVGLRLKGSGSADDMNGKPAFRVDMNEFVPGTRLRGLKGLTLNNGNHDATWSHEYITYYAYRQAGIPAPRTGWTRVYVNGEYFGLYMNIEQHDDVFLDRWYDDAELGALYEGGWSDFSPGQEAQMDYEEGPLPQDLVSLEEVSAVLSKPSSDETIAELEQYIDLDQVMRYMALEALTKHWDGYKSPNNWRFYHNPSTDLFEWIPTGTDWTLVYDWGGGAYQGSGEVFSYCMQNNACKERYSEVVIELCDLWDTLPLEQLLDHTVDLLDDEIAADPRKQHNTNSIESERAVTRDTLQSWSTYIRAEVSP
jgi:hypothetical protein